MEGINIMIERNIRRPKGPAIIFLLESFTYFFTLFSTAMLTQITGDPKEMEPLAIFRIVLWGATNLFMSIILFSKKYDNMLIAATGVLLIPGIFSLFLNITPYLISEIIFYLVLITFTYIMVKMPEAPIREKAVKIRFVIPLFKFVLILISTVEMIMGVFEKATEALGTPDNGMKIAIVLLPTILGAITGFLPVLCYAWLANWLAEPWEKNRL